MSLNLAATFKATLFSGVITLMLSVPCAAETAVLDQHSIDKQSINKQHLDKYNLDKNLADKLYRQALYFYFTGNYGMALSKISLHRQRFNADSPRSHLFEAGLQVSVGLHHQATKTLYKFKEKQTVINNNAIAENQDKRTSATSPEELLLIAFLQLAEQQIQQGENKSARQTLSKITQVSNEYNDQYHILKQLAYWPESPVQLAEVNNSKELNQQSSTSAYVALNQALLYIEQQEFDLAEAMLIAIKNKQWQTSKMTFWQLLFNPFSDDIEKARVEGADIESVDREIDKQNQQQALNDYAKLLLAQMYVKQARYESAYYELKNFPQDSPYTESALFIFAFSAHKIKHYTTSFKLFDLIQESYPYSNLGWQAALLLATQITEQKTIAEGMTSYQNAEHLYQQRLTDLADFHRAFVASDNVLNFAPSKDKKVITEITLDSSLYIQPFTQESRKKSTQNTYVSDSVWLQKALLDVELQAHYQALITLDLLSTHLHKQKQKSQWLKDTLILNNNRKAKIVELQQQSQYSEVIAELNGKKQQIAEVIAQAETEQQGQVFASKAQAQWLKRIEKSKQAITSIKHHKNTDDYQERLTRIEGVLSWQLQQELPERLWQHKKQLKLIDQQLIAAEKQRKRFAKLAASKQLLLGIENNIQDSSNDVIVLLNKVAQLRIKTSEEIQAKVRRFVDNQRYVLDQHLLSSRHEMAAVLEKMSQLDKRIKMQLTPSTLTEGQL